MPIITLDDFWKRRPTDRESANVRKVVSLTADLMTDQTDETRSIWAGSTYGGRLTEIRRTMPGGTLALTSETQRIADKHAAGGKVVTTADGFRIGLDITLTEEGLSLG